MASPTPVFPDVGSTMMPPGFSSPDCSAASIMRSAIRSLTEPPGLKYSTLASTTGQATGDLAEPQQWSVADQIDQGVVDLHGPAAFAVVGRLIRRYPTTAAPLRGRCYLPAAPDRAAALGREGTPAASRGAAKLPLRPSLPAARAGSGCSGQADDLPFLVEVDPGCGRTGAEAGHRSHFTADRIHEPRADRGAYLAYRERPPGRRTLQRRVGGDG